MSPIIHLALENVTNYKQQFIIYTELEAAKTCSIQISKEFIQLQSHIYETCSNIQYFLGTFNGTLATLDSTK